MLKRLVKNTAARSFAEIINRIGGALFWLLVARILGASALGAMAFALSLFSFFMTLSTLGLGSVIVRDVARYPERTSVYWGQALIIGTVTSVIAALLMITVSVSLNIMGITLYAAGIMALAVIPGSVFYWSKAVLTAHEKMQGIAWARTAENTVRLVIGYIVLLKGGTLVHLVWVIFASKIVLAVSGMFLALHYTAKPHFKPDINIFRYLISMIPAFSLITLFNSLFWSASVVLLTHFSGETAAGLFGAAFKLVDIVIALALAYGHAIFPIASRELYADLAAYRRLFHQSVKIVSLLTLAIAAGTVLLAEPLVHFLYGAHMLDAVPVLRILIWCIVPFSLIPLFSSSLVSFHQQKWDLAANAAASFSLIILNTILLPLTGAAGAAFSLLGACIFFLMIEGMGIHRHLFNLYLPKELFYALPGVLMMAGILLLLRGVHVLLLVPAGGVCYLCFLFVAGVLRFPDLMRLFGQQKEAGI